MRKALAYFPFLLTLLIASLVFTYQLDRPLLYTHDWNGAHYGLIARNHLRYGLTTTQLAQIINVDFQSKSHFKYDFHHPIGYTLVLSLSQYFLGLQDLALRLPSVLASLGMIYFLYQIAHHWWGTPTALIVGLVPIASPMLRYFASIPAQEPLVLAFVIAQLYWYDAWFNSHKQKHFSLVIICGFLAGFIGWPGYYLSPLLAIHYWWYTKTDYKKLVILIAIPILMLATHLTHNQLVTGDFWGGGLGKAFTFRLTMDANHNQARFTSLQFIKQSIQWLVVFYTRVWLLAVGVAGLLLGKKLLSNFKDYPSTLILILFAYGLAHPLIFRNAAFVHEYMWIYMIPFFSLVIGYAFSQLTSKFKNKQFLTCSLIAALMFTTMWFERDAFVRALFTNQHNLLGYQLGQIIKQHTQPGDEVLVLSGEFLSFFGKFAQYYGDRRLVAGSEQLRNHQARLIVVPTSHTYSQQTIDDLDRYYIRHQDSSFIWYDTKESGIDNQEL